MNIDSVTLRDLRYFQAVCEAQHVSWAAEALHVAQPTLSHALARLERAVGRALLERPRNRRAPLEPTAAGRVLLQRAGHLLALADGLDQGLGEGSRRLTGHLHLGSIQSLNLSLLPAVLTAFAADHPEVAVTVRTFEATAMASALRRGTLELAVVAGAPAESLTGLVTRELYREPFVAIVRHDDPLASRRRIPLRRLADRDLVLVPRDSFTGGTIHAACAEAGFEPQVRLAIASSEALRETVRAGQGITILPAGSLAVGDPDLQAVALCRPTPSRGVLVAEPAHRHRTAVAAAFVEALCNHAAELQATR